MMATFIPHDRHRMMAELLDVSHLTPELKAYLNKVGLNGYPADIEAKCSVITVALVKFFADVGDGTEIFRFNMSGAPAVVVGVHGASGEWPIDLVAWPLQSSGVERVATYRQEADVLGVPELLAKRPAGVPLQLHRHPHDWVNARFQGAMILNQQWGGHWLSKAQGPFLCTDVEHGRAVAEMLRPFGKAYLVVLPASLALKEAA